MDEARKRLAWKILSASAATVAAIVTRRLFAVAWRRFGRERTPDGRRVNLGAALTWAVAAGVGIGLARLIAVRLSARAWQAATHEAPPGMAT